MYRVFILECNLSMEMTVVSFILFLERTKQFPFTITPLRFLQVSSFIFPKLMISISSPLIQRPHLEQ